MIEITNQDTVRINERKEKRVFFRADDLDRLENLEIGWADWFGAEFAGVCLTDVTFRRCELITADFSGSKLKNVTFVECSLQGAKFPDSDEPGYEFVNCHFEFKGLPPWAK